MLIFRQADFHAMAPINQFPDHVTWIVTTALAVIALHGCGTAPVKGLQHTEGSGLYEVSPTRHEVVRTAEQLIGTPYRYGGNDPDGFDCSGLVQYTHRRAGIDVPRTTAQQLAEARIAGPEFLMPGDLLFFRIEAQKSRHVGIYEGDGVFIHAPSSGKQVSRASLENPYWNSRLFATRTFL